MLSAKDIAAVKTAIEVCNNPELKRKILCACRSDYARYIIEGGRIRRKNRWNEIVEEKVAPILKNLGLPEKLLEKVVGIVQLVGLSMLTWAEYHEDTLGFSREYSVNFLNSSFFTQRGIVDNKKAAEGLMKDESLNIEQKYILACLYCFTDHIPALYMQVTKEEFYDAERPQRIKQPELVTFWSYYLMGDIDKLKGGKSLDQYRLEKAVGSGSRAAVEFCLEETNLRWKKNAVVDAAVLAVQCRVRAGPHTEKDWVAFRNQRYKYIKELYAPSDYYVDILSFLLSKMGEDQQIEFWKNAIEAAEDAREGFEDSSVLEYFLNWPYQDYFMKNVKLMWEFLPERDYAVLLLRICDKIKSKEEYLRYSEGKNYDYRGLLREFWYQSPERYKRYVFSSQKVNRVYGKFPVVGLLIELLTLNNFSLEDRENIRLILASATNKEKENIFSSDKWIYACVEQMNKEKWETLNRFVLNCSLSKEEEYKLKREFSFTSEAKNYCIASVEDDDWNAAESFIKWSCLPEEQINRLKKEMIYSEEGMHACVNLISCDEKIKAVDKFISWCFPSEEEIEAFKKELVFSFWGTAKCKNLVRADQQELASEFIHFCLSSEREVRELKKNVAYRFGGLFCGKLIADYNDGEVHEDEADYDYEDVHDNKGNVIGRRLKLDGDKWTEVEKFLTWCFSSEEEINDFKKKVLFENLGKEIHFNLVKSNRWEDAETFFAWLGLSAEEIKQLKKDTIFDCEKGSSEFYDLVYYDDDGRFDDYGSREEAMELLLRWYLTDKETVLEFKDVFKRRYFIPDDVFWKYFDWLIEQRLRDLDEEKMGVKRKSETFSPNKKLCNLKLENKQAEYCK